MNPVLAKAIDAATEALSEVALIDGAVISWTDRTEDGKHAVSIEGDTRAIARTAAMAVLEVFDGNLLEKLVDSYLTNRTEGIREGRRLAVLAVEEKFSHPAGNGGQHWDSDNDPVPDWIRIAAMNAARGKEVHDD